MQIFYLFVYWELQYFKKLAWNFLKYIVKPCFEFWKMGELVVSNGKTMIFVKVVVDQLFFIQL